MSYYDQNVPPVRDQRLSIGNTFGGSICELIDCAKEGCLLSKDRSFQQSGACQMQLVLQMAATIKNSAILMHGPIGCGSQLHSLDPPTRRGWKARGENPGPVIWASTGLDESDVIGGGEGKLADALDEMDRNFRPEIIFIISTCAPNIIGDDVDEVVRRKQDEVAAKLVPVHCPGFKSRVVASSYDAFYHSLIRYVDFNSLPLELRMLSEFDPDYEIKLKKYQYQVGKTVNLLNASSIGEPDEQELTRLLNELDLKVRVYTEFTTLEQLEQLSQAALNISMCNVHDDYLLEFLKEKYNIPYKIINMPVGLETTKEWFISIAEHFGLKEKAESIVRNEENKVLNAVKEFLSVLRGKRVMIGGGVVRVASLAVMLKNLDMEVVGIRAYHYDNMADSVYENLSEQMPQAQISVAPTQLFEYINLIKKEKPDIVITHAGTNGWISKTGVISLPLFEVKNSYFGYAGYYDMVRRIAFALENNSYQKRLSENIKLPYFQEWYEKDPYYYIKE